MTDHDFDQALIAAAFRLAADDGWRDVSVAAAARAGGLSLATARARFPSRVAILLRFGSLADQAALADVPAEGSIRDKLFDLVMRRFDALQTHREGVRSLMRALPFEPGTALLLACANKRSVRWMLQAAGVQATGPRGEAQAKALLLILVSAVRAWDKDESADLSGTMAAVDKALGQAERLAGWLGGSKPAVEPPPTVPSDPGPSDPGPEI